MATPSAGAISILDISDTFGGSTPDNLSEYYRGGSYVADESWNNAVPTSGEVSLDDYYNLGPAYVDSATFTSGDNGAGGYGWSVPGGYGTSGVGMNSFGNSPAWDIKLFNWLDLSPSQSYFYCGGSTDVGSAAIYANSTYATFYGLRIQNTGITTFKITDASYGGYTSGSGYYYFYWAQDTNPFPSTYANTIWKQDQN